MNGPSLMIFAAGFGSRMGALTREIPKPMLKVGERPLIDRAVEIGRNAEVEGLVANTHYLAGKIEPHLAQLGVTISREEPDILDTGGGLRAASPFLTSPTLTLNPDVLWQGPNPLTLLRAEWRDTDQALLVLVPLSRARHRAGSGDFHLADDQIKRGGDLVYTGAQMIRLEALDCIPDTTFSLNRVWDELAARGALRGLVYPGTWHDVGTPEALAAANDLVEFSDV